MPKSIILNIGDVLRVVPAKGSTIAMVLPSGTEIILEVTNDTASITKGDDVLYNENMLFDGSGKWEQDHPKVEPK